MHELIEQLITATSEAMHRVERRWTATEPRRRRPRAARSTYVPVPRETSPLRVAH